MTAARGWAGDRLTRWERSPEDGVTIWETRWDSAANAREFVAAYTQVVQRRDPSTKALETSAASEVVLLSRFRRVTITLDGVGVRIEVKPAS